MKIAIIGTGYVGHVSGVCFPDFGHSVVFADKCEANIKQLKAGGVIYDQQAAFEDGFVAYEEVGR